MTAVHVGASSCHKRHACATVSRNPPASLGTRRECVARSYGTRSFRRRCPRGVLDILQCWHWYSRPCRRRAVVGTSAQRSPVQRGEPGSGACIAQATSPRSDQYRCCSSSGGSAASDVAGSPAPRLRSLRSAARTSRIGSTYPSACAVWSGEKTDDVRHRPDTSSTQAHHRQGGREFARALQRRDLAEVDWDAVRGGTATSASSSSSSG